MPWTALSSCLSDSDFTPLAPPLTLKLGNLPKEAYRLAFLVNPKEKAIDRELEISVQAGRIVGEIYDALLRQYESKQTDLLTPNGVRDSENVSGVSREQIRLLESDHLAALNRLCVRLVFCLYAEDAEIFPKDCFRRLIENTPAPFLRERLKKLFEILDTPLNKRDVYLEPELCAFPYTNGGLFSTMSKQTDLLTPNGVRDSENVSGVSREQIRLLNNLDDIPPITDDIRQFLIGASQFDWRDITPTILGALFESTLNPVPAARAEWSIRRSRTSTRSLTRSSSPRLKSASRKYAIVKMCKCANV